MLYKSFGSGEQYEKTEVIGMTEERIQTAEKHGYKKRMRELQRMLADSADVLKEQKRGMILVFEGLDASGKSGCIRRLTKELDTNQYAIHPIGKPSSEEYRRHYLHRFWTKLPEYGNIAFFDRSWYGRVLVERIEGFCTQEEYIRGYDEINEFEKLLADDGYLILKLWFEVTPEEQLRRFQARLNDPAKAHKITDEDWRNRGKRTEYDRARNDMLRLTDTLYAPWLVIDGNCKKTARIRAAEEILAHMEICLQT